jgi:hypothetical protein
MVVATYNMVSRFLLATDVAGISDMEVPWPVDKKEVSIFSMIFHVIITTTFHDSSDTMTLRSQTDDVILFDNFILELLLWE